MLWIRIHRYDENRQLVFTIVRVLVIETCKQNTQRRWVSHKKACCSLLLRIRDKGYEHRNYTTDALIQQISGKIFLPWCCGTNLFYFIEYSPTSRDLQCRCQSYFSHISQGTAGYGKICTGYGKNVPGTYALFEYDFGTPGYSDGCISGYVWANF